MASIYDLVMWAYYAAHGRKPPDPARYVLGKPGWLLPGATVLDYGGGEGRWAVALAERAALVVVADIDEQALRRVPSHARLRSVLLDGATLPFRRDAFDLVFVNHVVHHVEDVPGLLHGLRRIVRQNGRLVVIDFDPRASVTRIYRLLSRYRDRPCAFYSSGALTRLMRGQDLDAEDQRVDDFQYVLVASPFTRGETPARFNAR